MNNTDKLYIPVIRHPEDLSDIMAEMHRRVMMCTISDISDEDGILYKMTKTALMVSVGTTYPTADVRAVYDIWILSDETVAKAVRTHNPGIPALRWSSMDELRIPSIVDLKDIAEIAEQIHWNAATSDNPDIAGYWATTYQITRSFLFVAIGTSYPDVNVQRVYDIWVECGESISHCVSVYKQYIRESCAVSVEFAFQDIDDKLTELLNKN